MNATISFDSVLHVVLALVGVAVFVGLNGLLLVYAERKVAGFIQRRPGPYEVGPQGILQAVADALKLIGKQLVRPDRADPLLFWMAPVLAFFPVLLLFLPIPFSPLLTGWDVNLGLLLILAFTGFNVLALLLAGWGSNNKYGLLGAARAVAQSVAYEIPLLLSVLAIAFQEGTLSLTAIVDGQGGMPWQWNIAVQPLAFLIFLVSALGETNPHRILGHGLRHVLPGRIRQHDRGVQRVHRAVPGWVERPVPRRRVVVPGQGLRAAADHDVAALDLPARALRPAAEHELAVAAAPRRAEPAGDRVRHEAVETER